MNRTVPYYHRLEGLHSSARTLPRKANWAQLAGVIDRMVLEAIDTDRPVEEILIEAQREIHQMESGRKL
ncbi:MAG: hypothetical protein GY953_23275 [bacterium]|nr:hypothetical protein [bacterium]